MAGCRRRGLCGELRMHVQPPSMTGCCRQRGALENTQVAIYNFDMDISVTQFKHHCLEIIRRLEQTGAPVAITRRGKVVAQLQAPAVSKSGRAQKPWERLRAMGGRLLADPGESLIRDKDFEALR